MIISHFGCTPKFKTWRLERLRKSHDTVVSGRGVNRWPEAGVPAATWPCLVSCFIPEEGRQCQAVLSVCLYWRSALMVAAQLLAGIAVEELKLVSTCLPSELHVLTGMPYTAHVLFLPWHALLTLICVISHTVSSECCERKWIQAALSKRTFLLHRLPFLQIFVFSMLHLGCAGL